VLQKATRADALSTGAPPVRAEMEPGNGRRIAQVIAKKLAEISPADAAYSTSGTQTLADACRKPRRGGTC
jgi:hypothetical protein